MKTILQDIKKYDRKVKSGRSLTREERSELRKIRSVLSGIAKTKRSSLYKKVKSAMEDTKRISKFKADPKRHIVRHSTPAVRGMETDIDKMVHFLEKSNSVNVSVISERLNIDRDVVKKWGDILEKKGVLEIYYPIFRQPVLTLTPEGKENLKRILDRSLCIDRDKIRPDF